MDVIVWIIFGALVGWIASVLMETNAQQGALANILAGIIGSVLGGYIMTIFGYGGVNGFNIYSMFVAVMGAICALTIYRSIAHHA